MNDLNDLECDMMFGNDINFHMPRKQNESSQFKTPERNFEKASKESEFKYNARQLKEA